MYKAITKDAFTRVKSDSNGNPRYAIHFTNILPILSTGGFYCDDVSNTYAAAVVEAKTVLPGSRKFHNKQYGGGIVIQSYNLDDDVNRVNLHNMARYIDSIIGDNEVVNFEVRDIDSYSRAQFIFTVTDKNNALDSSNQTIYLNGWDDAKTIRHALANKSLISFNEV